MMVSSTLPDLHNPLSSLPPSHMSPSFTGSAWVRSGREVANKTGQIGKYFMGIHYVLVHTHKVLKLNRLRFWMQWSFYLNGWYIVFKGIQSTQVLWIHGSFIINVTLTASALFVFSLSAYCRLCQLSLCVFSWFELYQFYLLTTVLHPN